MPGRKYPPAKDRLLARTNMNGRVVSPDLGACWEFLGHVDRKGYGRIMGNGRRSGAHRVAYEVLVGPIPGGMTIDHLCRVRNCVNPDHLEAVPNVVNVMRGEGACVQHARKTHCIHGHEFLGDNLRLSPNGRRRNCRTCDRDRALAFRARRAA